MMCRFKHSRYWDVLPENNYIFIKGLFIVRFWQQNMIGYNVRLCQLKITLKLEYFRYLLISVLKWTCSAQTRPQSGENTEGTDQHPLISRLTSSLPSLSSYVQKIPVAKFAEVRLYDKMRRVSLLASFTSLRTRWFLCNIITKLFYPTPLSYFIIMDKINLET